MLSLLLTVTTEVVNNSNFPSGSDANAFNNLIDDFSLWIVRVGTIISFVGAIKFALATKDDDSKDKLFGILTMVSGFLIIDAIDVNLFTIRNSYDGFVANSEFHALMTFIRNWIKRLGGFTMFIGAIEFALSMRSKDAGLKITALKTIVAGAMISVLRLLLPDGI